MLDRLRQIGNTRSLALHAALESRLSSLVVGWLLLSMLASAARLATSPVQDSASVTALLPYMLLVIAPAGSLLLALRWFERGDALPQPVTRLARVGRWRSLSRAEAMGHPLYGASGIMVSLLIGMLLNIPLRAAEYLAAVPAVSLGAPEWLRALHFAMTLDVVLMSSLYAVAFVAALRRVPLFPRLLLAAWMIDIAMQLLIANMAVAAGDLPAAVARSLEPLLRMNAQKVLISMALWLPYLLLSRRVNVTYRHRVPA